MIFQPQPSIEARVLVAVICDAEKLAIADALEVEDFTDPRNQEAFAALRELQAHDEPTDVLSISDAIERRDVELERHLAEKCGLLYLANLVINTSTYEELFTCAARSVFEGDLRQLRKISTSRRNAQ